MSCLNFKPRRYNSFIRLENINCLNNLNFVHYNFVFHIGGFKMNIWLIITLLFLRTRPNSENLCSLLQEKEEGARLEKKSFLTTYCLFNVFCCKLIHNIMLKMYMYLINYLLGALEMNTALLFSYMQWFIIVKYYFFFNTLTNPLSTW